MSKIEAFQDSDSEHVYKCKDPRHTAPLEVEKHGLRCKVCKWEQKWVRMFLGES